MKQVYAGIKPDTGIHIAGICKLKIAPRDWLLSPLSSDFFTGKIAADVTLKAGLKFIDIDLLPDTYIFTEKAKSADAGQYWDTEISGDSNAISAELLQRMNSLIHCRFIAIVKDNKGRTRLVGDYFNGMTLMASFYETNKDGGEERIAITLSIQTEKPAPYLLS